MLSKLIDRICALNDPAMVEMGDRSYSDKQLLPVLAPAAQPLVMHTLTGLVDYIRADVDGLPLDRVMIHVVSHEKVALCSALFGGFRQREVFAECRLVTDEYPFNKKLSQEAFSIWLQTGFAATPDLAPVLKVTGTVTDEAVRTNEDDGVTQRVTARVGIARKEEISVPNPVALKPFRTFLEVEQPEAKFVYRMWRQEDGQPPQFSLHTADGGEWKLAAIDSIKSYFIKELPTVTVLG
ncbi:MAG: hypothetical protein RBT11_01765 [Desulfobacterales bacterium]|jgi:hypothetical protein|nr:hypothetical protein [Desulfobacterales bacterium]